MRSRMYQGDLPAFVIPLKDGNELRLTSSPTHPRRARAPLWLLLLVYLVGVISGVLAATGVGGM